MKKVILVFIILAALFLASASASATLWTGVEIKCPLCGVKDTYSMPETWGGYIYYGDTRFQYIFWPLTESDVLYTCQKCHFTCLMWDFEKVPKGKIADIKKVLENTTLSPPDKEKVKETEHWFYRPTYCFTPMLERIAIAEKVYRVLGQTDEEWCRFCRMKAYHCEEAGMHLEAEAARKKALEISGKMIADRDNAEKLKELYLVSGSLRYFLRDNEGARKDFEKGKAAPYRDSKLKKDESDEKEKYLNELLDEFLAAKDRQIELVLAVKSGRASIVSEILEKSPELITVNDKEGETLLELAIKEGNSKEVVSLLIDKGAREDQGNGGITLLHWAVMGGKADITELLISKGSDVNAKDEHGETPIFGAVSLGPYYKSAQETILTLLEKNGADLAVKDKFGRSPLHHAAEFNSNGGADFLISRGADVDARDSLGLTPLHIAVRERHKEVARFLLSKGADINATDTNGWTPLCYAIRYGDGKAIDKISQFLLAHGAKRTGTCDNAELMLSIIEGRTETCKKLLDSKPGLARMKDDELRTPLHEAIENEHWDIAKMLISCGADVNAKDEREDTPLHEAVIRGDMKMIEYLLKSGAEVNVKNDRGKTPLMEAEQHFSDMDRNKAMVELLRRYGAK